MLDENNTAVTPNEETVLEDRRHRDWFWDVNAVFDSNLSSHAILVRLYLARCANSERQAWPSLSTIAQHCKISRPTVIKAIRELENTGWIKKIVRQDPNGLFRSTVYIINSAPEPESPSGDNNRTDDSSDNTQNEKPANSDSTQTELSKDLTTEDGKARLQPENGAEGGKGALQPENESGDSKVDLQPQNETGGSKRDLQLVKNRRGGKTGYLSHPHSKCSLPPDFPGETEPGGKQALPVVNPVDRNIIPPPYGGDASRLEYNNTLLDSEHLRKERTVSEVQGPIGTPSASYNYTVSATEERSTYGKPSSDGRTSGSLVTESSNDRITPSSTVAVTEESRGAEKSGEQPGRQNQVGSLSNGTPTPPTNQQLIAELVKKFWQIPGVKPERGHYPMVGKAYIQYGYDAVQAGIHDLTVEFTWRQARGMPIPEGKDLWAYFIKKCQWNYKRPLTPEEIEERKKPSYDTVTCKRLPDGSVVPKTLDELMQTLMPPGHAYKVIGNTIRVYPLKPNEPAARC